MRDSAVVQCNYGAGGKQAADIFVASQVPVWKDGKPSSTVGKTPTTGIQHRNVTIRNVSFVIENGQAAVGGVGIDGFEISACNVRATDASKFDFLVSASCTGVVREGNECARADGSAPDGADWVVTKNWDAVPKGPLTTADTMEDCEASCTGDCNQFSWNTGSHHCYTSSATAVAGHANPRVVSGCRKDRCTSGCPPAPGPGPGPALGPSPGPSPYPCSYDVTGLYCALSFDEGATFAQRRVITDDLTKAGHQVESSDGHPFTMNYNTGEPMGYLAAAVADDGVIHVISSREHYAFNLAWLNKTPPAPPAE